MIKTAITPKKIAQPNGKLGFSSFWSSSLSCERSIFGSSSLLAMLIVSLVAARITEASREDQKPGKQERVHEDIDRSRDDEAKGDGEIGQSAGFAR